jgi:hypothetical protein
MKATMGPRGPATLRLARSLLAVAMPMAMAIALLTSQSASAADKIPRLSNGKPDFSGIWETTSPADYGLEPHGNRKGVPPGAGIVAGDAIPYLPQALEHKQRNFAARDSADPKLKGWTLGTPRGIYFREPFQVFQHAADLKIVFQFGHSLRTIYTNNTEHPDNANELLLGDSRGRWDGDTLVVDVRDFSDKTWLDSVGDFHSPDLHVVERWKFLDSNTVAYQATLTDPTVFSRPWTISVVLYRHREKNFQLIEDYQSTLDYEQYYPPRRDGR